MAATPGPVYPSARPIPGPIGAIGGGAGRAQGEANRAQRLARQTGGTAAPPGGQEKYNLGSIRATAARRVGGAPGPYKGKYQTEYESNRYKERQFGPAPGRNKGLVKS